MMNGDFDECAIGKSVVSQVRLDGQSVFAFVGLYTLSTQLLKWGVHTHSIGCYA